MLLETLNALDQAGVQALESSLGLEVTRREISLAREGRQGFLTLGTLHLKGCALQMVHLGCDEGLAGQFSPAFPGGEARPGFEILAGSFLAHLLEKLHDRNPRGTVVDHQEAPVTLHTRGVRTFQFGFETGHGRLYVLAEVPSRTEMAIAKGSDFLTSMESIYLPGDWHGRDKLPDPESVDSFLAFLRKTEGDVYLETPAGDGIATLNVGLLVDVCEVENLPALKLVTDFSDPQLGVPAPGSTVKASVGVGDRSLEFSLKYLGPASYALASGSSLPSVLFSLPSVVFIGQRRRSFRVSLTVPVQVEIESVLGQGEVSTWSDAEFVSEKISGRLADLSFSGARINAEEAQLCSCIHKDSRVVCRMFFPDLKEPVQLQGIVRRATAGPADRNQWQDDIGIEFVVSSDGDRKGLDYVRQFVLQVQRAKLAQRLQVIGS